MRIEKLALLVITIFLGFGSDAKADSEIYTTFLSRSAVGGYDTVAYFKAGKAIKGNSTYQAKYKGANWYFSSAENLAAFETDPQRYAPQYGGYCAWAVSQGYTAKGDPLHWKIYDNRLYLNFDESIKNLWLEKKDQFIEQADSNWPGVLE